MEDPQIVLELGKETFTLREAFSRRDPLESVTTQGEGYLMLPKLKPIRS